MVGSVPVLKYYIQILAMWVKLHIVRQILSDCVPIARGDVVYLERRQVEIHPRLCFSHLWSVHEKQKKTTGSQKTMLKKKQSCQLLEPRHKLSPVWSAALLWS